jgi:hypothetical protein
MTAYRTGDRVRMTMGQSVINGVIASDHIKGEFIDVLVDGLTSRNSFRPEEWEIEVIEPPFNFPETPGSIVAAQDEHKVRYFVRAGDDEDGYEWEPLTYVGVTSQRALAGAKRRWTADQIQKEFAPLHVVFDGGYTAIIEEWERESH